MYSNMLLFTPSGALLMRLKYHCPAAVKWDYRAAKWKADVSNTAFITRAPNISLTLEHILLVSKLVLTTKKKICVQSVLRLDSNCS